MLEIRGVDKVYKGQISQPDKNNIIVNIVGEEEKSSGGSTGSGTTGGGTGGWLDAVPCDQAAAFTRCYRLSGGRIAAGAFLPGRSWRSRLGL